MIEFYSRPDMRMAIESALCVVMLLGSIFLIRPMVRLDKKYGRFYLMIAVAVLAELCGLGISLPSYDQTSYLVSSPALHNALSLALLFCWTPMGSIIYSLSQDVFANRPFVLSRYAKYIALAVLALACLCLHFFSGLPFEKWLLQLNFVAFFAFFVLPLLLMALNNFLSWVENPTAKEEFYCVILSWLTIVYMLLSIGTDALLPLFLDGSIVYSELWQGASLLFSLYGFAFVLVSYLKIRSVNRTRMVFSLFCSTGDGVIVYDKAGRIFFANAAACALLDLSANEARNENIKSVLNSQSSIDFFRESYLQSLELLIHGKKESFSFFVIKDIGLIDSRCFILQFSKNLEDLQKSLGYKSTLLREQLEQQSVLQKMQREVRRQETLLKTFLDNLPMQVSVKNEAGVVILQNKADIEMNGKHVGLTESSMPSAERLAFEGLRGSYEKVVYNDNKSTIKQAFNYTYIPVSDELNPNMVLKICRDVTDSANLNLERLRILENEKRRAHLEDLGTLTGGIAHEFNNILGSQLGFLSLIKTQIPEDSPARKYVEQVEIAGERQKELIKKLLESTRSELSADEDSESRFSLAGLVMNLLASLGKSIPQNVSVENGVVGGDLRLVGSETKLGQVLSNLFNNAVYAMREKGGKLSVSADTVHLDSPMDEGSLWHVPAGDYVCIKVSDTGEGIPSNVLQRLFSPLFTTKPPGDGLGLGLFTSLSIVRAAQGEITVQSTLGKGTTFKVYWPLAKK